MKRILSLLLSILMLIGSMPISFNAFAETPATGSCGDNATYSFDAETGTLTISGTGGISLYSSGSTAPWSDFQENILNVVVEEGITSVPGASFTGCSNLTSFSIPVGVTSVAGFSGMTKLTRVSLPEGLKSINGSAFRGCTALSEINLPNSVTLIDMLAFSNCKALTHIEIPTSMRSITENSFTSCTNLTTVVIPEGVTKIGYQAFSGCSKLENINIPSTVTEIGSSAFSGTAVKSIVIPDGVETISTQLFSGCSNLSSITLPDSIKTIEMSAFSGCAFESFTLPDGIDAIPAQLFYNCKNLKRVEIPDSVTSIGDMAFRYCTTLESVSALKNVTSIGIEAFNTNYGSTSGMLSFVTILNKDCEIYDSENTVAASAKIIGYEGSTAQAYATKYNRVFEALDGKCGDNATYSFDAETGTLTISGTGETDNYFASGTSVPWDVSALKSVVVENGITSIGSGAFYNAENLTQVTIADSVVNIGELAFSGCTKLTQITLPQNLATIEPTLFEGCTALTSIVIPDSVSKIMDDAFYGCTALESVDFGSGVTSIIGPAFFNCVALKEIVIPDNVTSIDDSAFRGVSPDSVILGEGITEWDCSVCCGMTFSKNTVLTFMNPNCNITESFDQLSGEYLIGKIRGYFNSTAQKYVNAIYTSSGCEHFCKIDFELVDHPDWEAGQCGPNASYAFDPQTETLTVDGSGRTWGYPISYTGGVYDYDYNVGDSFNISPKKAVFNGVSAIWNCFLVGATELKEVEIGNSVTEIGCEAFAGTGLESVTLPSNVLTVNKGAFRDCVSLKNVTLPENMTALADYVFCTSAIESIKLPESLKTIGNSSLCDTALKSIIIPSSVENVGACAFAECTELESVTFLSKTCTICDEALTIPEQTTIIGYEGSTAQAYATKYNRVFEALDGKCGEDAEYSYNAETATVTITGTGEIDSSTVLPDKENIKEIVIAKGITSIGSNVFSGCTSLETVVIPETVESIGDYAFSGCVGLTELPVNDGIKTLGEGAFSGSGIVEAPLPVSVTTIKSKAFENCANLKYAAIPRSVTEISEDAFSGSQQTEIICMDNSAASQFAENHPEMESQILEIVFETKTVLIAPLRSQLSLKASSANYVRNFPDTFTFTGSRIQPSAKQIVVRDKKRHNRLLSPGKDYKVVNVSGYPNINVGKGKVKIEGVGKKYETVIGEHIAFGIVAADISRASATLSSVNYTYNGLNKSPSVKSVTYGGKVLSNKKDFTYTGSAKNVGLYMVTVFGKGNFKGVKQLYFIIKPNRGKITKLKKGKKRFTVRWKKQPGVDCYVVQYSTNKKFSNKRTKVKTFSSGKGSATIAGLKGNKKYYVRVWAKKTINGKQYGKWSKVKRVKTKK